MDIKKEFNRLQALLTTYELEHSDIDFGYIARRVEDISKAVELKLAELDEVREEYRDYLLTHEC